MDSSAIDLYERLDAATADATVVLDAGCGRGFHLSDPGNAGAVIFGRLRDDGVRIIGIDVAPPDEGNDFVDDLRRIGEDGRWPVEDASVDVVFSDWVLEHVAQPEIFFAECGRVLRPGGRLVARTMQKWSVAGIGARLMPRRIHTPVIQLLQPGFQAEDLFPTTFKCNTKGGLATFLEANGLRPLTYSTHKTLAGYGAGKPLFQRALTLLESALPPSMHHGIVIVAQRE